MWEAKNITEKIMAVTTKDSKKEFNGMTGK